MTEPTLTDLRETARMIVDCDIADNLIALARAFLSLTDTTPLNVIKAQALGLEQDEENEHEYIDGDNPTSMLAVMMGRDHTAISLTVGEPTVGQLRLALLQENRDGE